MLTLGANAVPIFFGGGGGGGGNNKPKCRYVAQTAYFPTYDTVYKQVKDLVENKSLKVQKSLRNAALAMRNSAAPAMRLNIRPPMSRSARQSMRQSVNKPTSKLSLAKLET